MENSEGYKNSKVLILQKLCNSNILAYEGFISQLNSSYLQLNQIVTPLAEKQFSLQRKLEILNLQKYILGMSLKGRNARELSSFYQNKIKNLKEEVFIPAYKDLLKARDGIYRNEEIITLNEKIIDEELQKFSDELEHNEMPEFRQFSVPSDVSVINELIVKIKNDIDNINLQIDEIFNIKEVANDNHNNLQYRLENFHETLNKDLDEYIKKFRDDEIKIIIQGKSLEILKKRLSLEKKKEEFLKKTCPGALHFACEFGALEIVKYLVEEMRYNILYQHAGYYPIHDAVKNLSSNCIDILNYLNSIDKSVIDFRGIFGRSPLHTATVFDNWKAAEWLVNKGADINLHESGKFQTETPLHNAAFNGNTLMVEFLLDKGANPIAKNKNEITPLMQGIKQGHLEVVLIFWNNGVWLTSDQLSSLLKLPLNEKQRQCLEIPLKMFSERIEIAMKKHSNN